MYPRCTPPKFNMEPEKKSLEKVNCSCETIIFRFHVKFRGEYPKMAPGDWNMDFCRTFPPTFSTFPVSSVTSTLSRDLEERSFRHG